MTVIGFQHGLRTREILGTYKKCGTCLQRMLFAGFKRPLKDPLVEPATDHFTDFDIGRYLADADAEHPLAAVAGRRQAVLDHQPGEEVRLARTPPAERPLVARRRHKRREDLSGRNVQDGQERARYGEPAPPCR